jgi:hypothetical protein
VLLVRVLMVVCTSSFLWLTAMATLSVSILEESGQKRIGQIYYLAMIYLARVNSPESESGKSTIFAPTCSENPLLDSSVDSG